ncbi:MAG: flagellar basal body P-ring formation chaperone FlgA [Gemmatimonas sp.]|jgi:flagella basal body P-ring formation protein FlgA|uniref:flagellar basal body P-ring formation chaperone FlgA n=1 Tax=Gemmatimonas sp. TaxID=1962908 RepID=UPI00391FC226|nr:flagellar basal body P-ring formation chaperone FlgA [Gemmatimonadota bacterium]
MPSLFTRVAIVTALLVSSAAMLRAQEQPADSTTPLRRDQRRVRLTVAARALARGETLRAEDIAHRDTVILWRWNSAPDTTSALPGWVTRRALAAGEVLRAPAVSAPPVISSGAPVTAIWQDGPLRLVITGVATNAATAGAPVGVRIDRTRRLDGIAVAPNTVRLR